ncbi:aldo/keto reductase [Sneathiella chungangensis]|uniref:Aldo/keto reductase n=1 Tax=Sneathiella chungangensis TaxID=1418234 RepID=A0A845MCC0_9PROT|nr:aldo/keto reductase [Sneathiella chungangensis]MZR20734.1 aldo/keto reductase [Sneathiella chungangensis]
MQKRPLGKNGLKVGAVGLGCMSFAGFYGSTDIKESHATLAAAMELGVDFLDTANVYGAGKSEEIIGAFIKDHPNFFKIATKGGIKREPGATERTFDNSEAYLRGELEKSLKRLGVEYVDLYYIHRQDQSRPIEEVTETLAKFKQEGKIGGFGFSEIAPATLRRAQAVHPVMAVQSEYSLWTRLPELGMVQTCEELGVTFVPFSPVGRGIFSKKPLDPATFKETDFRKHNPRFVEPNFSYNMKALEPFNEMAADKGVSPATLAIAWLLAQPGDMIPIPGTRTAAHLKECADAAEMTLTASDLAEIERILPVGFAHGARYTDSQLWGTAVYG